MGSPAQFVPSTVPPKYKRSWKNFLIDKKFQLKYAGYIVLASVAVSLVPIGVAVRASREVVRQGQAVMVQGQRAIAESRKVSEVILMSMKEDPVYGQNQGLLTEFSKTSEELEQSMTAQTNALLDQQQAIAEQQKTMLLTLCLSLLVMVLFTAVLSVLFTHKVAGPLFKVRTLIRLVGQGHLQFRGGLRRGDELQEFFAVFMDMVATLRARQEGQLHSVQSALEAMKVDARSKEALETLENMRRDLVTSLNRTL